MDIWSKIIQLLWKFKFFTRIGSIVWSVLPLLSIPFYYFTFIFMGSNVETGSQKVMTILSIAGSSIWYLLLAMIPQCIYALKDYVEHCEEVWNGDLKAPSKLIWIVTFMIALMSVSEMVTISTSIFGTVGVIMVMNLTFFYLLALGIVFGSLSMTLSSSCQIFNNALVGVIKEETMLKQATDLLHQYQALKAGSALGLFTVSASCTMLTIVTSYWTIVSLAYTCFSAGLELAFGIQILAFSMYFFFFAWSADICFKSFERITVPLR